MSYVSYSIPFICSMYEEKEIETHQVKYPRKSSLVPRQNQGINQCHNRKQCVSRQRMDEEARRLRRIGSIKEIGF